MRFSGKLSSENVKEVRDKVALILRDKTFTFVETKGQFKPPVVLTDLKLVDVISSWGKPYEEGHSGFGVPTTNGFREYNCHSSGLVTVRVDIEPGTVTLYFLDNDGLATYHVYKVQNCQ